MPRSLLIIWRPIRCAQDSAVDDPREEFSLVRFCSSNKETGFNSVSYNRSSAPSSYFFDLFSLLFFLPLLFVCLHGPLQPCGASFLRRDHVNWLRLATRRAINRHYARSLLNFQSPSPLLLVTGKFTQQRRRPSQVFRNHELNADERPGMHHLSIPPPSTPTHHLHWYTLFIPLSFLFFSSFCSSFPSITFVHPPLPFSLLSLSPFILFLIPFPRFCIFLYFSCSRFFSSSFLRSIIPALVSFFHSSHSVPSFITFITPFILLFWKPSFIPTPPSLPDFVSALW